MGLSRNSLDKITFNHKLRIFDSFKIRPRFNNGFTLAELLITVLISSVIAIGASSIVLDNVRITSQQDSILRLQENWNRIQFLIDQDLSEGSGSCFTTGSTLTIYRYNSASNINVAFIIYQLDGSNLLRSGPSITNTGSLDLANPADNVIVSDNVLSFNGVNNDTGCTASNPSQRISFTLGLREIRDGKTLATYINQLNTPSGYSRVDPIN